VKYDERYVGLIHVLYFLSSSVEIPVHANLKEFLIWEREVHLNFDILNSNCAYLAQDYKTVYLCPLRWFLSLLTDEMVITQQIESLCALPPQDMHSLGPSKPWCCSCVEKGKGIAIYTTESPDACTTMAAWSTNLVAHPNSCALNEPVSAVRTELYNIV